MLLKELSCLGDDMNTKRSMMKILAVGLTFIIAGCAVRQGYVTEDDLPVGGPEAGAVASHARAGDIPGVVEHVWEEPMVDAVDVPPGLDPEGHYYRPAHQEIVEIRQGRWRFQKQ